MDPFSMLCASMNFNETIGISMYVRALQNVINAWGEIENYSFWTIFEILERENKNYRFRRNLKQLHK